MLDSRLNRLVCGHALCFAVGISEENPLFFRCGDLLEDSVIQPSFQQFLADADTCLSLRNGDLVLAAKEQSPFDAGADQWWTRKGPV